MCILRNQHLCARSGFTLIEMLVVIAINTILLLVIFSTITSLYQTNSYTFVQAQEVDAARSGIVKWTQDAREMTFAADGSFPLVSLSTSTMSFFSDTDRDDDIEYIEYVLSSTTLYRNVHKPTGTPPAYDFATPTAVEIVSEYVQNDLQNTPVFTYYDSAGNILLSPAAMITDARYIEMAVIVNIDPVRSPGEFELRSSAAPRNIKDNL